MTRPRILMADDHTMLLDAFRTLLESEFDVVGTVTDGRKLLEEFSRLHPEDGAFHKYRMMEQLRLKTSTELVQFAVKQGVVA